MEDLETNIDITEDNIEELEESYGSLEDTNEVSE